MFSVSNYFLRIRTKESCRLNLSRVNLYTWIFLELHQEYFLLNYKKLIEVKFKFVAQLPRNLIFDLWLQQTLSVFFQIYVTIFRLVRLKSSSYHDHLLLVETLIKILLHLEVGIDCGCLWLGSSHFNRWI